MIKAILFDCFGVMYLDHFEKTYTHFGGDVEKDKEYLRQFFFEVSKGTKDWRDGLAEKLNITIEQWHEKKEELSSFNYDLLEYSAELRKTYKTGMLSNIGPEGLEAHLDRATFEPYFDVIVESGKIGFAKPEARAYEIAADRLGVRLDECVFTDDREEYIEGAQHVGMKTILFSSTEQFKQDLEKLLQSNND